MKRILKEAKDILMIALFVSAFPAWFIAFNSLNTKMAAYFFIFSAWEAFAIMFCVENYSERLNNDKKKDIEE